MTLRIREDAARRIRAHAAETYPDECCGALLGRGEEAREILAVFPLRNRQERSPRNRFLLAAEDVRRAERAAREQSLELLGWYHSHPDHPPRPSEYDREQATWPWFSYVIVAIERGRPGQMTSWRLAEDRSRFLPEEIEVSSAQPAD